MPLLLGHLNDSEERKKKIDNVNFEDNQISSGAFEKIANDNTNKPLARGFTRFEAICGHIWENCM